MIRAEKQHPDVWQYFNTTGIFIGPLYYLLNFL